MKYDRDSMRMNIITGSVIQANENAPMDLRGCLGIVTSKGPWGVGLHFPVPGKPGMIGTQPAMMTLEARLGWEQVDWIGDAMMVEEGSDDKAECREFFAGLSS